MRIAVQCTQYDDRLSEAYGQKTLEATLIVRSNYDLWKGQLGQELIQEIIDDKKTARKTATYQARTASVATIAAIAAVATEDELDG